MPNPQSILKVNPDNTINIKQVKNSWNREEVIELLQNAFIAGRAFQSNVSTLDKEEWIETQI